MRRRVAWITFLTTMVFWFGRAWAADPSADELMKMLEGLRPATQPGATPVVTTQPSPSVEMDEATTRPVVTVRYLGGSEPSLNGLDRSQWPVTVVPVDRGYTSHGPVYFVDLDLGAWAGDALQSPKYGSFAPQGEPFTDAQAQYAANLGIKPTPMALTPAVTALPEAQLEEALRGGNAVFADQQNVAGLFLQPLKFAGDLIMLPLGAIQAPPWSSTTTPQAPPGNVRFGEGAMPEGVTPMVTPAGR